VCQKGINSLRIWEKIKVSENLENKAIVNNEEKYQSGEGLQGYANFLPDQQVFLLLLAV
jgi:hypothetical protein